MERLSIVIPTLNAAEELPGTLAHLRETGAASDEILVADGGSADATIEIADRCGAALVAAGRGRGTQLAAGARRAAGDWLLFLHADTRPGEGWRSAIDTFASDPENVERAAAFRFALDDDGAGPWLMERLVDWRCRILALPYGDQGLIIGNAFYRSLGGYDPVPLMEDIRLVRRIGRRRLRMLDVPAVTSAARYRRGGYVRRPARNLLCLILYFAGLPPRWIARLYG